MKMSMKEYENYTLIHFELNGSITPDELKNLKPPEINPKKGVVLSGRGPIWLYCFLSHVYHPTPFVAVYDPRIGSVVVQSHSPRISEGDVIPVEVLP